jgi:hypothetical protein
LNNQRLRSLGIERPQFWLFWDDRIVIVMPGLDPGIHQNEEFLSVMDCRVRGKFT